MVSEAATFGTAKLQLTHREDTNLYNNITGRLVKDNVKRDALFIQAEGIKLYNEFIDERLQELTMSCSKEDMKNSNTKTHYVTGGKLHQLERHCDL